MICFYHSADMDGKCSGAIVEYAHRLEELPIEMIGIDYGQPFPWEKIGEGDHVYLVDFSLQPFSDMVRLSRLAKLHWFDHHKSAIEEAERAGDTFTPFRCVLDAERAACEICWDELIARSIGHIMPIGVHLLGRYDIWKHNETPNALEFQYGCRLQDTSLQNRLFWSVLLEEQSIRGFVAQIVSDGAKLLRYERMQSEAFCRAYAFETTFDGLRCIAANRGMSNSLLFESVWDPAKHDAMLMFAWKPAGFWTVSLYSDKPDVDVSAICKARGGGGHKGAAGFQCDVLPFLPEGAGRLEQ